jgi:threonine 3-dehydrogenase
MPVEVASIQEPFGNGVHSALQGDLRGQSVLVTGCGPIGLFCIGIARAEGAAAVYATDINDYRLGLATKMGADLCVNATREDPVAAVIAANGGQVDVALEMSGAGPAITQALHALRAGGWISLLGLPTAPVSLDLNDLVIQKGVTIYGIFGRRIWETWVETSRLLGEGLVDVSPIITHRLPLDDVEEAMRLLEQGDVGKIVMFPNGLG